MVWTATILNAASQAAASRMGFLQEGILRSNQQLDCNKLGEPDCSGQTTVWLSQWQGSITYDDWQESVKESVEKLMQRPMLSGSVNRL
jgi:RimJ/RimL family protein N-acetyltransferase